VAPTRRGQRATDQRNGTFTRYRFDGRGKLVSERVVMNLGPLR
jgi:hypothetical protein